MANEKPVAKLDPIGEVKKLLKSLNASRKDENTYVISRKAFEKIDENNLPTDVTIVHNKSNPDMHCFKVGDERIVFEVTKDEKEKKMEKKETAKKTAPAAKAPAKKETAKASTKASSKAEKAPAKETVKKPATKTEKPVKKAQEGSKRTMAPHTAKGRGEGYVVLLKKAGKKEQKITNMSTCAEIKEFLKGNSRKDTEYLRIYDKEGKECRKSAWIEK